MAGTFQTTRDIFDNDIWQRPIEFRMFFYLYGHAMFKDGVKIAGLTLKRGQYLTSIRRLQSGLSYIENNGVKTHSLSVLWRTLKKLEKDDRLTYAVNGLGTLVTIKNYDSYQLFKTSKGETWNADGTQLERSWNTDLERSWNNKNKVNKVSTKNKVNNDKETASKPPALPDEFNNGSKEYKAAVYLSEQMHIYNPKRKSANLNLWAVVIDKIFRIDKRTPDEYKQMVDDLFLNGKCNFWAKNIQSAKGLRDKWDRVYEDINHNAKDINKPMTRAEKSDDVLRKWVSDE